MTTALATTSPQQAAAIEAVVIGGDLGKLSASDRVIYYRNVCESLGLNPLTQPFEYLNLNGKLRLYARRDCTDQLRKIHSVSVTIMARERTEDMYVVTARATTPDGRTDESIGAVPLKGLSGEALANALMKGETKAKRRVTLAICGLAMLDESELEGVGVEPPPRKPGSGAATPSEGITPYGAPDEDQNPVPATNEGNEFFTRALRRLESLEEQTAKCVTYEDTQLVRQVLGSEAAPTQFIRELSTAVQTRLISGAQHKDLGKIWQRVARQLKKREKELGDAANAFTDPPDPDPFNDAADGHDEIGKPL